MILFINVLLTDDFIPFKKDYEIPKNLNRPFLHKFSNLDIFKYSISSLSNIYDWKKVILKISLDNKYLDKKQELSDFIYKEFQNVPIHLDWKRNEYVKEWRDTYDMLNDDLIWFSCNHDHIFLDSDTKYLNTVVNRLIENSNEMVSMCYSHWRENVQLLSENNRTDNVFLYETFAEISNRPINVDSIRIITKSIYKNMWFSNKIPDIQFPRPDWQTSLHHFISGEETILIPYKELCRHFDGYYDFSLTNPLKNNEYCSALDIPVGFFKNDIKISFGNNNRIDNYVWLNPCVERFLSENGMGVDYKWLINDIPLFWKNKISDTKIYTIDINECKLKRMENIIKILYYSTTKIKYNPIILELISNVYKI